MKYEVRSKTPGVPVRHCDTMLEAKHYKDLQSTWGYELEIIDLQKTITATDYGTPDGDKTVTVTAEKNGDEIRILDLKIEEPDLVNHPAHYTRGKVETIDGLESAVEGLQGKEAGLTWQVIKYMWRWKFKGQPLQDLRKAEFYLKRLIQYVEVEG